MRIGRKMRRELPRHRLDPLDDAGLEIPGLELGFHVAADLFPAARADMGFDAAVGDDFDLAVGEQQIDQHAVVVRGVPDPQMRKNVERALARGLIVEQRRAVERALDDKAQLAGMGSFAGLDRLLDAVEHLGRKDAPHPPTVLDEMLADAPDTHPNSYQLPDAPPPPKLPPPPENPLSLSLELE